MNLNNYLFLTILRTTLGCRGHECRGAARGIQLLLFVWVLCQGLTAQVSLPYATGFEIDDGYVAGDPLGGDWATTDASTVTTDSVSYAGLQSVRMLGASPEPIISLDFDPSGGAVLFADFYMRLTASPLPVLPLFTEPETTAVVAMQLPEQGLGEWVFLDGDRRGSGVWLNAGITAPLDSENLTAAWHRVTLRLNLATDSWDVYVDEVPLAVDLGFVERLLVGFEAINIHGSSAGVSYVDNFRLTATNPLFADADLDGMEDGFEANYGLNSALDDRGFDPDNDGLTNIEEYLYGTDPQVSNMAVIELASNSDNQTVVEVVNDRLLIIQNGTPVFDTSVNEVFGLAISGVENGNIGDITFESAVTFTGNLSITNAKNVTFNAPIHVTGKTVIKTSESLFVNAGLRHKDDVSVTSGVDFIITQGSIHVATGNLSVNAGGSIGLHSNSNITVDNTSAAFGNMRLFSRKTITVSDNSSMHSSNNYMFLRALEHISLVDNSVLSAAEEGFVDIRTNSGNVTVVDSEMSLADNDLHLYMQGSLRVVRSSIYLENVNAQFVTFVDATLEQSSSLSVKNGDLYVQMNRDLSVSDNSEIVVTEGNVGLNVIGNALVEGSSGLKVYNSEIAGDNAGSSAKKLQLLVSGTTTFDSGSMLELENTELFIFSFGSIDLLSSTLTVFIGENSLTAIDASIRTNGNLSLTDSTVSMDDSNLFVNAAQSAYITGSHVTMTDSNFLLNTRLDTIMDAGSTLMVTGGDLFANIFGKAILGGVVNIENIFSAYVQVNFTLTDSGSLDASTILLSSGGNIAIDGRMDTSVVDGRVFMNAQGSIYMKSLDPIIAVELAAISVTGIFLRTDVEQLTAQTLGQGLGSDLNLGNYTGSAEIEIHEENDVVLNTLYNANGPIRVLAGGTIQALQIISATDAPGHNIGLMATEDDLEVGYISAGATHGQVSLSAKSTIRELAPFDAAVDVSGNRAVLYAGDEIATGDAALELAVTGGEIYSFANENVTINTQDDIEVFMSTGNHTIDVVSTQGDAVVSYAENSIANGVHVEATNGDIYVGFIHWGPVAGERVFVTMSEDAVPDDFKLALKPVGLVSSNLTWSIDADANHGVATVIEPASGKTATIGYVPASNYFGEDSFVVQVKDDSGNTETITVHVIIEPVNDTPVITSAAPPAVNEAGAYSYTIDFTDVDASDSVTLTAAKLPTWLSFDGPTLSGVPTYAAIGVHEVEIIATDAYGATTKHAFTITVNAVDDDGDGMSDGWESAWFGNLGQIAIGDFDNDGMSNLLEFQQACDPTLKDTDGDGMEDMYEYYWGLEPAKASYSESQAGYNKGPLGDFDGDGDSNLVEFYQGMPPNSANNKTIRSSTAPEYVWLEKWFGVAGVNYSLFSVLPVQSNISAPQRKKIGTFIGLNKEIVYDTGVSVVSTLSEWYELEVNHSPVIEPDQVQHYTIQEDDQSFTFQLSASDVDGDQLYWDVVNNTSDARVTIGSLNTDPKNNTITVEVSPQADFYGTFSFEVHVSDDDHFYEQTIGDLLTLNPLLPPLQGFPGFASSEDSIEITITVEPINDAPRVINNDHLIGYWPLNEDVLDYGPYGNHGELIGNTRFVNDPTGEGKVLQTTKQDWGGGYVKVLIDNLSDETKFSHSYSGAVWVQFDDRLEVPFSPENFQPIIEYLPGLRSIGRNLLDNNLIVEVESYDSNAAIPSIGPVQYYVIEKLNGVQNAVEHENVWYHIAWTITNDSPKQLNIYVNGVLSSSIPFDFPYSALPQSLLPDTMYIGANFREDASNLKISQLRIFGRVLSEREVAAYAGMRTDDLINNRYTLSDFSVNEGSSDTLIYLRDAFYDIDNDINDVTFTVSTDNDTLISAMVVDGVLHLDYQDRAYGKGVITVVATDNDPSNPQSATETFMVTVNKMPDTDGDELPDWWEFEWFDDLSQDALGDADRDGVSNADEYVNQTNPKENCYTVTFELGSTGSLLHGELTQSVIQGGSAIEPSIEVIGDHHFLGWDQSFDNITSDLIINAIYSDALFVRSAVWGFLASDRASADYFGSSVDISGNTAIIGAWGNDLRRYYIDSGSVYIFERNENSWGEKQKLVAWDEEAGDRFGSSVAISGDTAVVGAPRYGNQNDPGGHASGCAYVFVREDGIWRGKYKLTAEDASAADWFGDSVDIDGDTIIVGSKLNDELNTDAGAAYIFTRNGDTWEQQAKLIAHDSRAEDHFGSAVSLSGDIAIVGAYKNDTRGFESGSAYIFRRSEGIWSQWQKLEGSQVGTGAWFGASVSVEGNKAIVGAPREYEGRYATGSAYVFESDGYVWRQTQRLVSADGTHGEYFGASVRLHGFTVLVGASADPEVVNVPASLLDFPGHAYVFRYQGGAWQETQKFAPSDGLERDRFGYSVGLTGDTALVGSPHAGHSIYYSPVNQDHGKVYFYDLNYAPVDAVQVTFNLNENGSVTDDTPLVQLIAPFSEASAPQVKAKPGYHFVGWDVGFSSVSEDLEVHAQYVPTHTVTFDLGYWGTLLDGELTQTVPQGKTAVAPSVQPLDGIEFVGWDKPYHNVTGNLTVRAQYADPLYVGVLQRKQSASNSTVLYRYFGGSVSICGDTAVIGAYGDDINLKNQSGSAYVYVRHGHSWLLEQKLVPSDPLDGIWFGSSVSVSGDTAVVGCYRKQNAYVFVRSNGVWTQQAKLSVQGVHAGDWLMQSVSIDGDTVVIGVPNDDDRGKDAGAAYVFQRIGQEWFEQGKLYASDGAAEARFGWDVDIDGNTVAVGAFKSDILGSESGNAYVFARSNGLWREQQNLVVPDVGPGDWYGYSVSVSGQRILVGAPKHLPGDAFLFHFDGNIWALEHKVAASNYHQGDWFGYDVDLDGTHALVGAFRSDTGNKSGAAYLFHIDESGYAQQEKFIASDAVEGDEFGHPVAVSGRFALIGAEKKKVGNIVGAGSAYFFNFSHAKAEHIIGEGDLVLSTAKPLNQSIPGFVLEEAWHDLPGSGIDSLYQSSDYPASPTLQKLRSNLNLERNVRDNYGVRIRGYLVPSVTGNYAFRLGSDGAGEFWLSADSNPAALGDAPTVSAASSSQNSSSFSLSADEHYYFELMMKEDTGDDYLTLSWSLNGGSYQSIEAENLASFAPNDRDRDGILDADEWVIVNADDDDEITTLWDFQPTDDFDLDGLDNLTEFELGLDATDPDTDGDGLIDSVEQSIIDFDRNDRLRSHADIIPHSDFDGDLLSNLREQQLGTDPTDAADPGAVNSDRTLINGQENLAPVLWLRADTFSGGDGSPVSDWQDASGNANHALQTNPAYQPSYAQHGYLGHPAMAFDGVNDSLSVSAMTPAMTGYTVYLFLKFDDLQQAGWIFGDAANSDSLKMSIATDGTLSVQTDNASVLASPPGSIVANSWNLISFSYAYGIGTLSINGETYTMMRMTQAMPLDSLNVGNNGMLKGKVVECILFDYALDEQQLNVLDAYMLGKTLMGQDSDLDGLLDEWELAEHGSLSAITSSNDAVLGAFSVSIDYPTRNLVIE